MSSTQKTVSLLQILYKSLLWIKEFPHFHISLGKGIYHLITTRGKKETSIGEFFLRTVNKHPNNKVLYFEEKSWTYKELNEWVNRLADSFISKGIKKGDTVVVLTDNRPELLAISLALSKIGGVASLINYSQKHKALVHSIQLSKAKLILVGVELLENFNEVHSEIDVPAESILVIPQDGYENTGKIKDFDILASSFSSSEPKLDYKIYTTDPTMYIFTSGTTGLPKAAIVNHGRWIKGYSGFGLVLLRLLPSDVLYVPLPFYHATAMIVCWASVVAGGAGMVMKRKFSVSDFWEDVKKYKVTAFGYVGELCKYLLNAPVSPLEKNNTLTKVVGNGLRPQIWMEFKERFGIEHIAEFYASSEGNLAFFNLFNMDCTMGYSVYNFAIVEYDKENECPVLDSNGFMKEVGTGGTGLLIGEISEKTPFDGYTEKEKSEKSILRDVFEKGDAYFNSGDLVYDMGHKHTQFVDRLGDTFRWKSENVSTTEVEGVILGFEGIAEAVVYGVEIPNQVGRAGMAKLIFMDGVKEIDFDALYNHMKNELPPVAIPLFLRVSETNETTGTMKNLKHNLKEEAYDFAKTSDPISFLMPDKKYELVTSEIKDNIDIGAYRL